MNGRPVQSVLALCLVNHGLARGGSRICRGSTGAWYGTGLRSAGRLRGPGSARLVRGRGGRSPRPGRPLPVPGRRRDRRLLKLLLAYLHHQEDGAKLLFWLERYPSARFLGDAQALADGSRNESESPEGEASKG